MSLIIQDLTISGLMSFSPYTKQTINLNTNQLTVIMGVNLDGSEGESNGSGKTSIIDALSYNYFGKCTRISNQGLLNYVESGPLLTITNQMINNHAFRIERGDNPSILRLFEKFDTDTIPDDDEWYTKVGNKLKYETSKSKKPETTKRIIEILGFDLKLFDVLLLNNPSDKSCFFKKDEEEQRNIIERIFGFTVFTEKANSLRELRKEENKILISKESALIATKEANDRIKLEIVDLEEKSNIWKKEHSSGLKLLTQQVTSYAKIDFSSEIIVHTKMGEINQDIDLVNNHLLIMAQNIKTVSNAKNIWDKENNNEIKKLSDIIDTMKQSDPEGDIKAIQARYPLERQLEELQVKIKELKKTLLSDNILLDKEKSETTQLSNDITRLEQEVLILKSAACPTCHQKWNTIESKNHLKECQNNIILKENTLKNNRISELKQAINSESTHIQTLNNKIEFLTQTLSKLPNPITFKSIEEATGAHAQLSGMVERINILIEGKNPHLDSLLELANSNEIFTQKLHTLTKKLNDITTDTLYFDNLSDAHQGLQQSKELNLEYESLKNAINPYIGTINNLRSQTLKPVNETEVKQLKNRIEHMSLLITLLSDRDSPIRKQVLSEWLPRLNSLVNKYLDQLELPHRITFDANMTATFDIDGAKPNFSNLSAGQGLRVWLATNLAFRDIFEMINYRINLFFVDEVLDKGMSARGAEVSFELLSQMAQNNKSVFLISHKQELADIAQNTITITLENKLSTIN